MKYLKVMFGNTSGANSNIKYKIDEVNVAEHWNPSTFDPKEMGGFNFSIESKILRYLIRGDTLYDVEVPTDAEVIECPSESAPHGIFRSNKIILHNPRLVTDDIAMDIYLKSDLPEKSFYKSLIGCAIRGYKNTSLQIIKDKINKNNIDLVLSEVNDFITPERSSGTAPNGKELYDEVIKYLNEIKSDLLISRFIYKEPYIKEITKDKIINITGESGSGKSTYCKDFKDYIIIDTDIVFSDKESDNLESVQLRNIFKDVPKDYLITNFDDFYLKVLDYYKDTDKTIVIDSAQYRNIKDISILKGKIIVLRTDIETCYQRTLDRWKSTHEYNEEEYNKFAERKKGMFSWYNSLNNFLERLNSKANKQKQK